MSYLSLSFFHAIVILSLFFFFFQAEDGIRDVAVTGVQTCALPICSSNGDFDVPVIRASLLAWLLVPLSRTTKMLHTSAETKPSSSPRTGLRSIEIGRASCRERV